MSHMGHGPVSQSRQIVRLMCRDSLCEVELDRIRGKGDATTQLRRAVDEAWGYYTIGNPGIAVLANEPGKKAGDLGSLREAVAAAAVMKLDVLKGLERQRPQTTAGGKQIQPVGQGDFVTGSLTIDIKSPGSPEKSECADPRTDAEFKKANDYEKIVGNLKKDPNLYIVIDTSLLFEDERNAYFAEVERQCAGNNDLRSRVIEVSALFPERFFAYSTKDVLVAPPPVDDESPFGLFGDD